MLIRAAAVREAIKLGEIEIQHVSGEQQLADTLTKALLAKQILIPSRIFVEMKFVFFLY